jgi:oligoendopeptidase F
MKSKPIKTTWDLTLLYKNEKDPQIEKDMKAVEVACIAFEKKFKGKDFTSTTAKLLAVLKQYETLNTIIGGHKAWWYFRLRTDVDSADDTAQAQTTRMSQRFTGATNKLAFFSIQLGKIPSVDQKKFLKESILKPYRYFLQRSFETAKYNLSEGEEQLAGLLAQTSYTMWIEGQEKILSQKTITHKGKQMPLGEASNIVFNLSTSKERRVMEQKLLDVYKEQAPIAEAEVNAVYNYYKVMSDRRGYKHPYSGTVVDHENDEDTVVALVDAVTGSFKMSHRFYSIQAKLLGEKKLFMSDRAAKIGNVTKKFDLQSSVDFVRSTFTEIGQPYADVVDRFLDNGQLDVYPRKGKGSGAYCWGAQNLPTYIFLNHTDSIKSIETLAHELGHGIHTEFSKRQPELYQNYSTATAEVASTFFEQAVSEKLMNQLPDNEKIILLHSKIQKDIATVFRQIACFNFELELHNEIRAKGQLSHVEIASLLQKHLKSYVGKTVDVTHDDGYFFVTWSHIRRFFYVYSYAYGQLVSRALYENWKKDKSYAKKIEQFLSAGGSMSPKDIFKSIGIDTSDPEFFKAGLRGIESDINELEKLSKKWLATKKKA